MAKRRSTSREIPKEYRVFVSHATYDKWIAKILCEKLEAPEVGATTYRDDRDIEGGDDIPESIKKAIQKCRELIVLLTPESVGREWIFYEIAMAYTHSKRIVPLLYHVETDRMPALARDRKGYHLNDLDQYLNEVKARVQSQ